VVSYPAPSTRSSCNGIKVTHQFTIQIEDVGEVGEEEKQREANAEELCLVHGAATAGGGERVWLVVDLPVSGMGGDPGPGWS
jgi:hypothetical protein